MPWNPNVPNVINRVQDDLAAIRENFQHLDPLAPVVNELQAVSGLAPVAGELQAVSALAPYVQALLDSRIVDHNLDVAAPPNGYYVRWQNGLQLCWTDIVGWGQQEGNKENDIWVFPAAFKERPHVAGFSESYNQYPVHFWIRQIRSDGNQIPFNESQVPISRYRLSTPNNYERVHLLAIGRWK